MSDLADRVSESTEALATRQPTVYELTAATLESDRQRTEFTKALAGALPTDQFLRIALTELRNKPKLLTADRGSLLGALMVVAQLGLEPGGPLGHAYLIPYRTQVQLIIGYKGYIALASREGIAIDAHGVHANDRFTYGYGLNPVLEHVPADPPRGPLTHVWAIARQAGHVWYRVLPVAEVEEYRARSAAVQSGKETPWDSDYEAMAIKTVIRRLVALLPLAAGSKLADAALVVEAREWEPITPAPAVPLPDPDPELLEDQADDDAEIVEGDEPETSREGAKESSDEARESGDPATMSSREDAIERGKTHFVGDDCPGGHHDDPLVGDQEEPLDELDDDEGHVVEVASPLLNGTEASEPDSPQRVKAAAEALPFGPDDTRTALDQLLSTPPRQGDTKAHTRKRLIELYDLMHRYGIWERSDTDEDLDPLTVALRHHTEGTAATIDDLSVGQLRLFAWTCWRAARHDLTVHDQKGAL